MAIKLDYQHHYSNELDETQWVTMINYFLDTLYRLPTGNALLTRLDYYKERGKEFTIQNYRLGYSGMPHRASQYPITSLHEMIITIPSTPYFINVNTVKYDALDIFIDSSGQVPKKFKTLKQIADCNPVSHDIWLNPDSIEPFTFWNPQPYIVMLAHELIHMLRFFEGFDLNNDFEEISTICGYSDNSLYVDDILITENRIRKDLLLPYRIDHSNREVDVFTDITRFSGTVYTYEDYIKY